MDFYYIYTSSLGKTECTKGGFCFGAFLLTFFFTLSKRLWLLSLFILASSCASYAALRADVISFPCYLLFEFAVKAYVGCSYFDWVHSKLKRTGYSFDGVVFAHDPMHARLVFMECRTKEQKKAKAGTRRARKNTEAPITSEDSSDNLQE